MMFKKGSFEVSKTVYPVSIKVALTLHLPSLLCFLFKFIWIQDGNHIEYDMCISNLSAQN